MMAAVALVVLALLVTGCMLIPGPGNTTTIPAVTSPAVTPAQVPVTLQPRVIAMSAAKPLPVTPTQTPVYENTTCAAQGGTIVTPGEQCNASYLPATDSFSCCSENPVASGNGNVTITIPTFDLSLNLDDNPGNITP
jgi:hypothetical protein